MAVHDLRMTPARPTLQPLLGLVVPGGEFLECLLGMRIALADGRLRESTLGVQRNGGCSVGRDSHAHSADLRRGADEGHVAIWRATGKLREVVSGLLGVRSRQCVDE